VCKGNCVDVQVELTGEPPFTLAYNNPFTGQTIKTFFGQAGIIQICIPSIATPGSHTIEAIKLTDKHCVCE